MSALAAASRPVDQSTDDLDLVAAVRVGDDRAFELLWERYQARIAAYVRGMVRDHGRAEDITQEVFLSALRRMRATDREIIFRPWIYEIAKNACIDAFRRTHNTSEVSIDADDALGPADHGRLADSASAPDAVIDSKLAIDNLCGAMGEMSQTHRDILVLREFEGLSYREIGDRLGMSGAAVESTLFRARRKLGEEYDDLVSGERCVRVRSLVDAPDGRAVGMRDRRRLARHVSHCQPCRRYALHAGMGLAALRTPATKIAALLPLPAFLRRRLSGDDAGQAINAHSALNVMASLDPSMVSGWSKAVATAATLAVAGLGAGAAVKERDTIADFFSKAPSLVGLPADRSAEKPAETRSRAARISGTAVGDVVVDQRTGRASGSSDRTLFDPATRRGTVAPGLGAGGGATPERTADEPAAPGAEAPIGGVLPGGAASQLGSALSEPADVPARPRGPGPLRRLLQGAGGGASAGASAPSATGASPSSSPGDAVNGVVTGITRASGAATSNTTGGSATSGGSGDATTAGVGASAPAAVPDLGGALTAIVAQLNVPAGPT